MNANLCAWTAALCLMASCGAESKSKGSGEDGYGEGGTRTGKPVDDCKKQDVLSQRATPDMLIVLDKSASMTPQGNETGTDRWRGSVDAVVEISKQFQDKVRFGLMTYPAAGGGGRGGGGGGGGGGLDLAAGCNTGALDIPVAVKNGDAIASSLGGMHPSGYTPTAATLTAALDVIGGAGFNDQRLVAPKYVLLVTDGDPNCSDGRGPGLGGADQAAREATIAAIEELTKAGVRTYVVGYQTANTSFAEQLDRMAAAGGTGETQHHSVASGKDLSSQFEKIASRAVSCSYMLGNPVDDPSFVLVTANGKSREYGNLDNGWTLGPDMQTVTLTGAACDEIQKGGSFSVQVVCEPVVLF